MTAAPSLTLRQRQVAELVADGLSYKKIGDALGMSIDRVQQHVYAIASKVWEPEDGTLDPRDIVFLFIRQQRWARERAHLAPHDANAPTPA